MAIKSDQQLKHNDCGVSAVKSVFNFFNLQIDRDYIASRLPLDANGVWLHDVKKFFEQHNFKASYTFLDLNTLRADHSRLKDALPCIVPVKNPRGLHYVVIYGVEGKRLLVLDPAEAGTTKWSFTEFVQQAYTSTAQYDALSGKQVLQQLIRDELRAHNMPVNGFASKDETAVANKLTYFAYLKEHYGFASKENETKFLNDLLHNLGFSAVPDEFRSIKEYGDKLRVQTPMVLSIARPETVMPTAPQSPELMPAKKNMYGVLLMEMHRYRKIWYIYIFAAIFAGLITQLMVFINQLLIDEILPGHDSGMIILFAFGVGLFKLFDLLVRTYKKFISIQLANIFDSHFLTTFIKKLNSFPIRYIHSFNRGDLTERMKDSLALKTFFLRFFTNVLTDSMISIYSLIILFLINWKISLIVLAIMVIFIVWFRIITPRIRDNEKRRFLTKSGLFSALLENIDGLQVVKSFNLEYLFEQRIQPAITRMMIIQKKLRYISLFNATVIDCIIIFATILIMAILSLEAVGSQAITAGQIITYITLSNRIFYSITGIVEENIDLQENGIILKRYLDFDGGGMTPAATAGMVRKITDFSIAHLSFCNVSFAYVPEKPVLKNFTLSISRGEKIRLEGSNGAGKTTFCKILAMLYPPTSGDILVNNEKLVHYNPAALRKKILLVSNDDSLFNDTLGFNITFNKETDTRKILALARDFGFHDFIAGSADGFDHIITEQGKNLSTGQRKKILLLRAFLSDAELIIIDEVLSGIDKGSKSKIEDFINRQEGRTIIIISHEPVENIRFDKQLTFHNGRLSGSLQPEP